MATAFFTKVYLPDKVQQIDAYSCYILEQYTFVRATRLFKIGELYFYRGVFEPTGKERNPADLSLHLDADHVVIEGDYTTYTRSFVPQFELFGYPVSELLASERLTLAQICQAAEVPESTLHQWLHGKAYPLKALIGRINARLAYLFPDTSMKQRNATKQRKAAVCS